MNELEERLIRLELRLQDGFLRIGEAMQAGIDVDNWERVWIELLHEYERLNDELMAQPPAPVRQAGLPGMAAVVRAR